MNQDDIYKLLLILLLISNTNGGAVGSLNEVILICLLFGSFNPNDDTDFCPYTTF